MNNVKIENINTKVVKEVPINLSGDFISTKEWKIYEEKKVENVSPKKSVKEEK